MSAHITRAEIVDSKFGFPTMYSIRVEHGGNAFIITRRYTDFERLRDRLGVFVSRSPALQQSIDENGIVPMLPPKAVFCMMSGTFRASRQEALNQFLSSLLNACRVAEIPALVEFLQLPQEVLNDPSVHQDDTPGRDSQTTCVPQAAEPKNSSLQEPSQALAAAPLEPSPVETTVQSDLADVVALRKQRWLDSQQCSSGANRHDPIVASSAASRQAPIVESSAASSSVNAEPLRRLQILPMHQLPPDYDGEDERMALLRDGLSLARDRKTVMERGLLLEAAGFQFAIVKCEPTRGYIDAETVLFVNGPALPRLKRLQFVGLKNNSVNSSDLQQELMTQYILPHLRDAFTDKNALYSCIGW